MTPIDRGQLKRMMEEGAVTVLEVLSQEQYDKFHLPGALNVPLNSDFEDEIQQILPDKTQPVAVYCMNATCDASPKAAQRLETLGYERVYDYVAGKVDWKEAGLPIEE